MKRRYSSSQSIIVLRDRSWYITLSLSFLILLLTSLSVTAADEVETDLLGISIQPVAKRAHILAQHETEKKLIQDLLAWIVRHSYLRPSSKPLPLITLSSNHKLTELAFGNKIPLALKHKSLRVMGLFHHEHSTVYLHETVDLDTVPGRALLLHELVHYLQQQDNRKVSRKELKKREQLAYKLEVKYLKDNGMAWLIY